MILLDKAGILRNLEKLVDAESNILQGSPTMGTMNVSNISEFDKIPFQTQEIDFWVQSLIKIRQIYAEIFLHVFLYEMDEEMVKLLRDTQEKASNFNLSKTGTELSEAEKNEVKLLEKDIKFENLGIFNEEKGYSMMRMFFRYILVFSSQSKIQITPKIKTLTKIFLNLFANVQDINLASLRIIDNSSFIYLEIPGFLEYQKKELENTDITQRETAIITFINLCENYYILEKNDNIENMNKKDFDAFTRDFQSFLGLIGDIHSPEVKLALFMHDFLWIFLQVLKKFNNELSKIENSTHRTNLLNFINEFFTNNVFLQSKAMQSRFVKLLSDEGDAVHSILEKNEKIEQIMENVGRIQLIEEKTEMLESENEKTDQPNSLEKSNNNENEVDPMRKSVRIHENPSEIPQNFLNLEMIRIILEKFPCLAINNRGYFEHIFKILQVSPKNCESDYIKLSQTILFISKFLKKKNYMACHFIPHYDLYSLESLLNNDYGHQELFKYLSLLLETRVNQPLKHQFYINVLEIIVKASKTRLMKKNCYKLRTIFTLKELKVLFISLQSEKESNNLQIRKLLFHIMRNIYIKCSESVFDDKDSSIAQAIRSRKKKLPQKSETIADLYTIHHEQTEETNELHILNIEEKNVSEVLDNKNMEPYERPDEKIEIITQDIKTHKNDIELPKNDTEINKAKTKLTQSVISPNRGRHVTSEPTKMMEIEPVNSEIWFIMTEELRHVLGYLKKLFLYNDNEKKIIKCYMGLIFECMATKTKQEISDKLVNEHKRKLLKMKLLDPVKHASFGENDVSHDKIIIALNILKENDDRVKEFLTIDSEVKDEAYDMELEIELEGVSGYNKQLLRGYKNFVEKCDNYYNSIVGHKNLKMIGEMVKRFSNKLDERQKSVLFPYETLKSKHHHDKYMNNAGLVFATVYESFKLKKLSTYSSMKKSDQDESNENVFFQILKESKNNKDGICFVLCNFVYTELCNNLKEPLILPSEEINGVNLSGDNQPNASNFLEVNDICSVNECFNLRNRNYKYVLLEAYSNVLFHATNACQSELYPLIIEGDKNNMKMLDVIWQELLLNLNFIYNQSHQDIIWREYFMRTMILIKFLQYLCEDNNFEFKKLLKDGFMKISAHEESSKFDQIKTILLKLYLRNEWGKKSFLLMKRKYLFPIIQAFFDFLAEIMCGPCVENQLIITEEILDFCMIGNLLNTFDGLSLKIIEGKDIKNNFSKEFMRECQQFNELKASICDCLLICCEGNDDAVMGNQYNKFNFYEIIETIVNLLKLIVFKNKREKNTRITVSDYLILKKLFKKSKFTEQETVYLDIALKLFIYLNNLSNFSFTLKHILESKKMNAKHQISKEKNALKNIRTCCKGNNIIMENIEEKPIDLTTGLTIKFLNKFSTKIEIIDQNENSDPDTKEIYFKSSPDFSLLSRETKETFLEIVDRTSHESKIHGLVNSCQYFEKEINIRRNLLRKYPLLGVKFSNFKPYEIGLFILCIIINILMLLDYKYGLDSTDGILFYLIELIGLLEFIGTTLLLIIWMIIRYPIEKSINYLKHCEQKGIKISQINNQTHISLIVFTLYNENLLRVLFLHILCTILGINFSFGFFAIDLFSIINLSATFQYLAKSISSHSQQLIFTFYMVIIFIYVFSVFSNLYFKDKFQGGDDDGGLCQTLTQCFFAILTTGFTNGSGIGGMLNAEVLTEDNMRRYFGYVIINLTFFIFVNCILLNIVFGIIVDTFGELREESEKYGNIYIYNIYIYIYI